MEIKTLIHTQVDVGEIKMYISFYVTELVAMTTVSIAKATRLSQECIVDLGNCERVWR